jgi:hypothetical protein
VSKNHIFFLSLLIFCTCLAQPIHAETYRVILDSSNPGEAVISISRGKNQKGVIKLLPARNGGNEMIHSFSCNGKTLTSSTGFVMHKSCKTARWKVRLKAIEPDGMDATTPYSGWHGSGNYWLLVEQYGWMRPDGEGQEGVVTIWVKESNGQIRLVTRHMPGLNQPPFYAIVSQKPPAELVFGSKRLLTYGNPITALWRAQYDKAILAAWSQWDRDIAPANTRRVNDLEFIWLPNPKDFEQQGDPQSELKLKTTYLWLGLHETYHSFTGAAGQNWPEWANESLANYFAWQAAEQVLSQDELSFIEARLFSDIPTIALLAAQQRKDAGDGSMGWVFYTKGAQFWKAIDAALETPANDSGRLAALLQSSNNFNGLDWSKAGEIRNYFGARSTGKTDLIIDCFLLGISCSKGDAKP